MSNYYECMNWLCLFLSKTHPLFSIVHKQCSQFELVTCTFSTIPTCPFPIQRIFHLLVFTSFLYLLSANYYKNDCMFILAVVDTFLICCASSKTSTADLSECMRSADCCYACKRRGGSRRGLRDTESSITLHWLDSETTVTVAMY